MPLLPPEPFLYPPTLFEADEAAPGSNAPSEVRWWVLHTRPRTEKALARRLLSRDVTFFLPQQLREWISRGRRFSSHLPLFPGYLFLCGGERERGVALETNLIVHCLQVHDQAQLRDDLRRVFRLMTTDAPLTPEEHLGPGDPVEITQGALAGLQGRVVRRGKNLKFVVEVHFLRQGVSIEIERWMIEPVREGLARKISTKREPMMG